MATVLKASMTRSGAPKRRATNVSLPVDQLAAAKELGINVSQACSEGVRAAVSKERARRWYEENKDAIDKYNAWVEKNGTLLADIQALQL